MPAYIDHLKSARDRLAQNIAEAECDYLTNSSLDGKSDALQSMIDAMHARLLKLNEFIIQADPFEGSITGA